MSKILVIKLGALGDFVQATPAFFKIQELHRKHELVLLTQPFYTEFAKRLGLFSSIIVDERQSFLNLKTWKLLKRIRHEAFSLIYDLQNVDRTRAYRFFFPRKTKVFWADRSLHEHSQDRLRLLFGLTSWPELDLRFLAEPFPDPLPSPYGLLIPGCSLGHPEKRWPLDFYRQLALELLKKGITPVIIGGGEENFDDLVKGHPSILNLSGKTSLFHIIDLASKALFALGNDTGPMFLAASGLCKTFCLHGAHNPPNIGGHKGSSHTIFFEKNLACIKPDRVLHALCSSLDGK